MFEFLHVAPGADWVIIFMAIAGGFALYIGIGIILADFGRDIHNLIKAWQDKRSHKIGNWKVIEVDTHSENQE